MKHFAGLDVSLENTSVWLASGVPRLTAQILMG